jgi:hypothetical protein
MDVKFSTFARKKKPVGKGILRGKYAQFASYCIV